MSTYKFLPKNEWTRIRQQHLSRTYPKKRASGDVSITRFADDIVLGFQYQQEAAHLSDELAERLGAFGLTLHPGKTRLIEFGRFAAERRQQRGQEKPETFEFLGFVYICSQRLWVVSWDHHRGLTRDVGSYEVL